MSLFLESINKFFRREKRLGKQLIGGKKLSLLILASFFVMISTPIEAKTPDIETNAPVILKFDTGSANLFSDDEMNKIIPGESLAQREQRLRDEAEKARLASLNSRRDTVSRERRVYSDPSSFDAIYVAAGNRFGVHPMLLKAIHQKETGASGSTMVQSYAGAVGPMQFLPSTFRRHAVDGNGDGIKDIGNVEDAIFTAAAYLVACGYPNVKSALMGYNPSISYYNNTLRLARSYGFDR